VLNTVYKDAIINREKMLSILKGPKFEQILHKAQANWNDFTPTKEDVITAVLTVVSTTQNFKELNYGQLLQFHKI